MADGVTPCSIPRARGDGRPGLAPAGRRRRELSAHPRAAVAPGGDARTRLRSCSARLAASPACSRRRGARETPATAWTGAAHRPRRRAAGAARARRRDAASARPHRRSSRRELQRAALSLAGRLVRPCARGRDRRQPIRCGAISLTLRPRRETTARVLDGMSRACAITRGSAAAHARRRGRAAAAGAWSGRSRQSCVTLLGGGDAAERASCGRP